jgi:hypothetical protein
VIWLVDISNHQGAFDVGRAVSEGYAGVWMKATEGTTWRDGMFDTFAGQALAAGAVPGAYHYLRAGSGRAQCDVFYGRIRDHGGPDGWLAACDNESDASWQTTVDFFARWRELAGDHPLFMYSGNWWWSKRGWDGASLTPYLWDSRYVTGSGYGAVLYQSVPDSWWSPRYGGWGDVTVLQFSSSGLVAGRSVDVNAFRGTREQLLALTGTNTDGGNMTFTPQQEQILIEGTSLVARMAKGFDTLDDGEKPNVLYRMITALYEVVPAALSEIRDAVAGAVETAREARSIAEAARVAAVEARDTAQLVLDRVNAMAIGNVDVAALAAALAPLLPSVAEVADAVVDEEASRLSD